MSPKLIYLVEDDHHIQELIKYNLEENGFAFKSFDNGEAFLKEIAKTAPNLFLLDIMLPDIDGLELCRRIRQNTELKKIPIIMLTAKGEEFDKVLGLELGADDYITKPFGVRELIARIKVALRRQSDSSANDSETIVSGRITIDLARHEVTKGQQLIELTYKEFELLKLLLLNKGKVLPRELLLEKIWGFDYYGETRTVDVHVRYLRQKLEDNANEPIYIETVRGIGYRFNDKEDR